MPDTRRHPRFALAAQVDARPLSGAAIFTRDDESGSPVELPDFTVSQGLYEDAVAFSNGFGGSETLASRLSFQWVVLGGEIGAFSITINEDDKVAIAFLDAGEKFELLDTPALRLLGFPNGTGEIESGSVVVAPNDWVRGVWRLPAGSGPPSLTLQRVDHGSATIPFPWAQDVRCLIRGDTVEDLDFPTTASLTELDAAENDLRVTWGVDEDGHHWWSAIGDLDPLADLDPTFARDFGWTGEEVPVVEENGVGQKMTYCRSTHRIRSFISPRRPLVAQVAIQEEESETLRLTDGSFSSNHVGTYLGWRLEWVAGGPDDVQDDHSHWLRMRREHLQSGVPVSLYQNFGDSRRALDPADVNADQDAYDLLYTSERGGYRGRIRCRLHPSTGEETIEWESQIRNRARITTRLAKREE